MQTRKETIKEKIFESLSAIRRLFAFFLLLVVYLVDKTIMWILNTLNIRAQKYPKIYSFFKTIYVKTSEIFDYKEEGNISTYELIELSFKNLKMKKARTIVTVGGMTIGIAAVVFLVSIGYGLQDLVVSRVARLDEMKQIDVSPQPGSKVKLNDEIISNIKGISSIESVLPLIAVVGRVNYQSSISDVAVYGVTKDYLEQSAIKPTHGKIFESNNTTNIVQTDVKGVAIKKPEREYQENIGKVDLSIPEGKWFEIRKSPDLKSELLGYIKRPEGVLQGNEVIGYSYKSEDDRGNFAIDAKGKALGKWVKIKSFVWKKENCSTLTDAYCINGKYTAMLGLDSQPKQLKGYITEKNIAVNSTEVQAESVLGVSTATDWVDIPSESDVEVEQKVTKVEMPKIDKREVVVNSAMLTVLGLKENEAVGKKFLISFVVVGELLQNPDERVESTETEYTIIGVIPDTNSPIVYIPFIDVRSLGIINYSQLKVKVKAETDLAITRSQIEGMGFNTTSVVDTVTQITTLFSTFRTLLALIGMVALSVAALGMFNTLTVSLLERTREVGLMKAMGMKSSEIQELFLTESMIIGFFGGVLGIFVGFLLGKGLGLVLSIFTVFRGAGFVDVAKIPLLFIVAIVTLSLFVGVVTGIYPARRATKISALNALRYE